MYGVHRIVAAANTGADIPAGHHASHLCDIRRCFRRGHIIVESIAANNRRKGCLGSIVCKEHGHVLWACAHQPACIRVPTVVQTCCLKVEQARRQANTTDAGQQMSQPDVDDYTAAALASHDAPDMSAAVRTYAEVVRSRSVSRQSSVVPSSQPASQPPQPGPFQGAGRGSSSRGPPSAYMGYSGSLTPAQEEAVRRANMDLDAW